MARKGGSYSYQKFMKEQARAEKKRKKLERKQQKSGDKDEPSSEAAPPALDGSKDDGASGSGS